MVDLWRMSAQMCMQSCTPLHIMEALGILRELITIRRRTARVAFWDPPSGSKTIKDRRAY